ncbi:MAG: phenazine biosynthesis protein PhzF [Rhizobiales bacterium 65-9]|nr:PhzF family phenazine biosynthesis protein [Hyphomicrobiales bacterium]OJY38617.1 MAG: phenazine biosynthesis protein PhzF [Rhizobiales bacterium 65-9]
MRQRAFATLDVFTTRRFAGNPLAVVLDGEGLSDDAMLAVTREFNLSETVFVLPARHGGERAFIRIFTPGKELPFAGHPTVGTATLLALRDNAGGVGREHFTLGEKVGPVPCAARVDGDASGFAAFTLPKPPETLGVYDDDAGLAEALGVSRDVIGFGSHRPSLFSAGVPFPLIPLSSRAAVDSARLAPEAFARVARGPGDDHVFVYCKEPVEAGHHYYARMFAPGFGIAEDPATGAAVAAFAGAIMTFEKPDDGSHRFIIEQGYAMGRPSDIELTLHVDNGALSRASIGGAAVVVTEGVIFA